MSEASLSLFPDTRKVKANSKFAGEINGLLPAWKKINAPKLKDPELKETKLRLDVLVQKARKIIKHLEDFTFAEFGDTFFGKRNPGPKISLLPCSGSMLPISRRRAA